MPDYSNHLTPLTAAQYAYTATLARGPLSYGSNPSKDVTGTYTTQPGDTVGSFINKAKAWYAHTYNVPAADVVLFSYSLREK